jgi:hypothetical protein
LTGRGALRGLDAPEEFRRDAAGESGADLGSLGLGRGITGPECLLRRTRQFNRGPDRVGILSPFSSIACLPSSRFSAFPSFRTVLPLRWDTPDLSSSLPNCSPVGSPPHPSSTAPNYHPANLIPDGRSSSTVLVLLYPYSASEDLLSNLIERVSCHS